MISFTPLLVGTGIYQGARVALSLAAAAALSPASFGGWVIVSLVLQYSSFAVLGFPNGAGREIPLRLGQNRPGEADAAEDVATTGTMALALLTGVVGGLYAGAMIGGEFAMVIGILLGATIVAQHYFFLQQAVLRARFQFGLAAAQLVIAGLGVIAVGVMALDAGVRGLILATLLALLAASVIGSVRRRMVPRLGWDIVEAKNLVRIGLPIALAGLGFSLLTTVDRWLVFALLGETSFGVYGLVGIVVSGLLTVSAVISQQFYPRIAYAYGAQSDSAALLAMARRQGTTATLLVTVVAVPTLAATWLFLPRLMPDYADAVVPATIAMVGVLIYATGSGAGNLLNSVGAQTQYLALQLGALTVNVVVGWTLVSLGAGLVGAAGAFLLTMVIYVTALQWRARSAAARLPSTVSGAATEAFDT